METNKVEVINALQCNVPQNAITTPAVSEIKTENISELLAGKNKKNVTEAEQTEIPKKKGFSFYDISGIGLIIYCLANMLFLPLFLRNIGFLKPKIAGKLRHIKKLKNLRIHPEKFKPVSFVNTENLPELKKMAKDLGIKLEIHGEDVFDARRLKKVLFALTEAHNKGKGRIVMPKKLVLCNISDGDGGQYHYKFGTMFLDRGNTDIEHVTLHELGHANDLRKVSDRIRRIIFRDSNLQSDITKNISKYAASSPDEFVAETFAKRLRGKSVPEDLMKLYQELKGPVKLPVIRSYQEYCAGFSS